MCRSLLLLTVLLGLAVVPFPATSASASCAAPFLQVEDGRVLQRGSTVTVAGRAFTEGGCQDTGACQESFGCHSCDEGPPPVPATDVRLRLEQGGRTWRLGAVDAGSADDGHLGWVSWSVDVPRDVRPGPATLVADGARRVRVVVR